MIPIHKLQWYNRVQRLDRIRERLVEIRGVDCNYRFNFFKKDMERVARLKVMLFNDYQLI